MQTQSIHKQIKEVLEVLQRQHQAMENQDGAIPHAEMEEFLAMIRQAYELALMFNHRNALRTMEELEAVVARRFATSEPARIHSAPVKSIVPQAVANTEENKPNVPVAETPAKPIPAPVPEMKVAEEIPVKKEQPATNTIAFSRKNISDLHEKFEDKPTLGDRFEDHETLGERIATKQSSHRIAEKLQKGPVKDLKAAIGLNEKFLFINQLFAGDHSLYNQSIEALNSCANHDVAVEYIRINLQTKYNWNLEDSPASLLLDLVHRKYKG